MKRMRGGLASIGYNDTAVRPQRIDSNRYVEFENKSR